MFRGKKHWSVNKKSVKVLTEIEDKIYQVSLLGSVLDFKTRGQGAYTMPLASALFKAA